MGRVAAREKYRMYADGIRALKKQIAKCYSFPNFLIKK
jgi:hypothetical protein